MKEHYLNHRKRLKERFSKAPDVVPDAEIIELLLGYVIRGKDVKPQAKELLAQAKSFNGIFEENLRSVKGIGDETLLFFNVLREFINRADYQKIQNKYVDMSASDAVHKFLKTKIGHSKKEIFMVLLLDLKNRLKSYKVIRLGSLSSVAMSARDVIEEAIASNSARVIIAHNHPSGDPTPSKSDFDVTKRMCLALKFAGLTLLDHIVITYDGYYSMSANGYINQFNKDVENMM